MKLFIESVWRWSQTLSESMLSSITSTATKAKRDVEPVLGKLVSPPGCSYISSVAATSLPCGYKKLVAISHVSAAALPAVRQCQIPHPCP